MSNLIQIVNNQPALCSGVGPAQIKSSYTLFIKNQKEQWNVASSIVVALALHYTGQEHVEKGGKGDVTMIQDYLAGMYNVNRSIYNASAAAFKSLCGLKLTPKRTDVDGKQGTIDVQLLDKDGAKRAAVLKEFPLKVRDLNDKGLYEKFAAKNWKKEAVDSSTNSGNKGNGDDNGESSSATQASYASTVVHDSGLESVMESAGEDEEKRARLEELAPLFAEFAEEYLSTTNPTHMKQALASVLTKAKQVKLNNVQGGKKKKQQQDKAA